MKEFKVKHFLLIVLILVFIDQVFKIYIKTNFLLGEEKMILGEWFRIHFIENAGMAFGWTLGDSVIAKIALTVLRIVIIVLGIWYIIKVIKKGYYFWVLASWTLVISGAIGNLIDSVFYGLIFEESGSIIFPHYAKMFSESGGYGSIFQGKVVDMLYFPLIQTTLPEWFPIWGGDDFEFFRPVFNIADSCITVGFILIIIFTNWVYPKKKSNLEKKNI